MMLRPPQDDLQHALLVAIVLLVVSTALAFLAGTVVGWLARGAC